MDYGIKGKTAVVTGADSGMGFMTARMLLDEGVKVVIADQYQDQIDKAAAELSAFGDVFPVVVDVTDAASVDALRDAAVARLGAVDFLVNAAGVTGATGDFHTINDAGWLDTLQVLLMGTVRVVRAFVPAMVERKAGRIILFGSEDAEQPYADELPYCAAKAGILNLAKGLSKTYSKHGVLVNSVSPAYIATPMTDAMMEKRAKTNGTSFDEAIKSFLKEERPTLELQRRGRPEEVASLVVFLCSKHATFINGANMRVDGGSVATV
ncbi:SDR family NAD(P)-dependent oxidoreductase [Beijerinckia sp. L45]|uniref:SDR family NAD(P)-dependent oxidoreductase n=1 Tax=Beijerinckia sp. L45 TaxID=1641855 RepID=UPI00131E3806|nr:SDR family oxidoreductase [Beijerinckia sp. L45]